MSLRDQSRRERSALNKRHADRVPAGKKRPHVPKRSTVSRLKPKKIRRDA